MPRYMIIVKATQESEKGVRPTDALFAEMADYHQKLAKAGMLLDAAGLWATSDGWRIEYKNKQERSIVDGPFAETKELVAGYTLIKAASREEAIEWTKRFPNPSIDGGRAQIEVRRLKELEDFEHSPVLERFKDIEFTK